MELIKRIKGIKVTLMKNLIYEFLLVVFLVLCFFGVLYFNSNNSKIQKETQETNFSTTVLPKMGQ